MTDNPGTESNNGPWMPQSPDPTAASKAAVDQATEVTRRDILALRGIIETRLTGADQDRERIWNRLAELPRLYEVASSRLRDEIMALAGHNREVITQRLNDLDIAAKVAAEHIERIPADNAADAKALAADFKDSMRSEREYILGQLENLQTQIMALDNAIKWRDDVAVRIRAELDDKIAHLKSIHDKDLETVHHQFRERDARFDREAQNAKDALAVALTSAEKQVALQTQADALAAQKIETSFSKQLDAIGIRVDELKERIDRGEGHSSGTQTERTEHRLSQGAVVSLVIAAVASIGLIITIVTLILKH